MLDNQLIQAFLPIINAGLIARGYTGIIVRQAFQPTQQGADTGPSVYFYKVSDNRYGFPSWIDVWDTNTNEMVHTETEVYETVFQINALVTQDPTDINGYTASDLVNVVSAIMQSADTVAQLDAQGIGLERITAVRNPYFLDDRDRNEASPSFDFTLTHKQIYTTTVGTVTVDYQIYPI